MKKTIYTIACIALFSIAANAQDHAGNGQKPAQQDNAPKGKVKADGTLSVDQANEQDSKGARKKTEESAPSGNRMAISEKGLPAPKGKEKAATTTNGKAAEQPK